MTSSADAIDVVCSFRPTSEVKRVIFWFSSTHAFLSHTQLVHLFIELSRYYTARYEAIVQYVVVSPSFNSRRDVWTYGIFKYLLQAQVLLPDARLIMLPHDLPVRDADEHQAMDVEEQPPSRHPRDTELVKHFIRVHYGLDLWNSYEADHLTETELASTPARHAPADAKAATDAPNGPYPNAPRLAHTADESISEAAPADSTRSAEETASVHSERHHTSSTSVKFAAEHGIVSGATHNSCSRDFADVEPNRSRGTNTAAQVHALPSISATIANQTLRPRPPSTHPPLLHLQPAIVANEDTRTKADAAVTQDMFLSRTTSMPGSSASSRSPNKDRERNQSPTT